MYTADCAVDDLYPSRSNADHLQYTASLPVSRSGLARAGPELYVHTIVWSHTHTHILYGSIESMHGFDIRSCNHSPRLASLDLFMASYWSAFTFFTLVVWVQSTQEFLTTIAICYLLNYGTVSTKETKLSCFYNNNNMLHCTLIHLSFQSGTMAKTTNKVWTHHN